MKKIFKKNRLTLIKRYKAQGKFIANKRIHRWTSSTDWKKNKCWASPKSVSLSAESDKGVALDLRAFEKARAKLLSVLKKCVSSLGISPTASTIFPYPHRARLVERFRVLSCAATHRVLSCAVTHRRLKTNYYKGG